MYEPLIREFYFNVKIREDELDCWVRGHEFTLNAHDIDEVLGLEGLEEYEFINYKDRMLSLETVQNRIGGQREGKCLNTTVFPLVSCEEAYYNQQCQSHFSHGTHGENIH